MAAETKGGFIKALLIYISVDFKISYDSSCQTKHNSVCFVEIGQLEPIL